MFVCAGPGPLGFHIIQRKNSDNVTILGYVVDRFHGNVIQAHETAALNPKPLTPNQAGPALSSRAKFSLAAPY